LESSECLGLTPGPVQSEHVLSPKTLAEWVFGGQRLELSDQIEMKTARQIGLDPSFESCNPHLLELGSIYA
jgi:hypothetical protein